MEELENAINKLVNSNTQIIVNPETFKKMVAQGLPISYAEPAPVEEYIPKLFETRKAKALEIIRHLPARSNFAFPSINALYDEIYECIIFGLNGAAITLCSILVEFALKQALYFHENGNSFTYNPTLFEKLENITLGPVIQRVKESSLIDDDLAKRLMSFKDDVRNPYNHYNTKKITKNVVANNVRVLNINTHKVETVTLEAKESPMIHAQAKRVVDREMVLPVFLFADMIVRHLFAKIDT